MTNVRDLNVGDIISIYNVIHKITRVDETHIATKDNNTLILWAFDEIKDVEINLFWSKQLNFNIINNVSEANNICGVTYVISENCLYYMFNDAERKNNVNCANLIMQSFKKCNNIREFQHYFYNTFNFLPKINF